MIRFYKIAMLVGIVGFCTDLSGQSIERQVLASSGAAQSATGVELSSTTGEAVTANFSSGSVVLDQGFQQGDLMITDLAESKINVDYKLYPNPTSNQLNLNLTADKSLDGMVIITTIEGRQMLSKPIQLNAGQAFRTNYNLQHLSEGTYLLSIRGSNGDVQLVERIQKVN